VSGGVRTFAASNGSFLLLVIVIDVVFRHKHVEPPKPGEGLSYKIIELISRLAVTFITPDGDRTTLQVREGDSLLDIAHEHDIDLEGMH
jgi:ferredoxin-2, mitochondrial